MSADHISDATLDEAVRNETARNNKAEHEKKLAARYTEIHARIAEIIHDPDLPKTQKLYDEMALLLYGDGTWCDTNTNMCTKCHGLKECYGIITKRARVNASDLQIIKKICEQNINTNSTNYTKHCIRLAEQVMKKYTPPTFAYVTLCNENGIAICYISGLFIGGKFQYGTCERYGVFCMQGFFIDGVLDGFFTMNDVLTALDACPN